MKQIFFYRLPVVIYCMIIFWQSSFPSVISEPLFPHDDKVFHLVCYAVLAVLVFRLLKIEFTGWSHSRIGIFSVILTLFYGILDEVHQFFIPERFASVPDVMADLFGAILGVTLFSIMIRKKFFFSIFL